MKDKTLTILIIALLILNIAGLVFQYLLLTRLGEDVDVAKGQEPTGLYQAVRAVGNACVVCASETEEFSKEIEKLKSRISYLAGEVARLKKPTPSP